MQHHQRIIRRTRVKELSGLSTSTIDRREKAGDFPRRVQLGANAIGWYEQEVLDWLASRPRGGVTAFREALSLGHCGLAA